MKTWIIGFAALALGLGAVITADQMGMLRPGATATAPASTATPSPSPSSEQRPDADPRADKGGTAEPAYRPLDPLAEAEVAAEESAGARLLRAPAATCNKDAMPITLGHPGVVDQAGIRLDTARPATGAARITATGRIAFPTDRHARLSSRAAGVVTAVLVDLGHAVEAGQELLRIDSAELGAAIAKIRQARAQEARWQQSAERQRQLAEDGIGNADELSNAEAKLLQARAAVAGARQELHNLGLTQDEIAAIVSDTVTSEALVVRAPFAGSVIGLSAAPGEHRERGQELVTIADTSRVWAMLDVPERDLRHVRIDQQVPVRADAGGEAAVTGTITWIAPTVDARTRTVPVRVELDNSDGRFRAGQFVVAAIPQRQDQDLVLVPREAVQWDGCCNVVFVPGTSEREFLTRKVQVDHRSGAQVALAGGIDAGQQVVTGGSWLLKTEILKGSIGAGCCEVH